MLIERGTPIPARPARNPASRVRIERIISRSVALFATFYGVQALWTALREWDRIQPVWAIGFVSLLSIALVALVVGALFSRSMRLEGTVFVASWCLVVALWPLGVSPSASYTSPPWPAYLMIVTVAVAVAVWPVWAAGVAAIAVPLEYILLRRSEAGGAASGIQILVSVGPAVVMSLGIVVIVVLLRRAAVAVESAQSQALDRYSAAVGQQATEDERVQVDAIVHDSVLAALLAAARAETAEAKRLATTMASDAIASLKDVAVAAPDDEPAVTLQELERRIRAAVANVSPVFRYHSDGIGGATIPARAARAVQAATVQSIVNSAQHAGDEQDLDRWVSVTGTAVGGVAVEIGDTGRGFDVREASERRVGIRVSIIERVSNAGGSVEIDSTPGRGTCVHLLWPSPDNPGRLPYRPGGTAEHRAV